MRRVCNFMEDSLGDGVRVYKKCLIFIDYVVLVEKALGIGIGKK